MYLHVQHDTNMYLQHVTYIILGYLLGAHVRDAILVVGGLGAGAQYHSVRGLKVTTQPLPQRDLAALEYLRVDLLCLCACRVQRRTGKEIQVCDGWEI